jgi:NarL family two-component system response regulator LiaR
LSIIRVLMVDDHRLFLEGLRGLLEMEPDLRIVGTAANGYEALAAVERLQPDVVLMDINMPGLNGVDATRQIIKQYPAIGIIILTMYREEEQVFQAIKSGARGYILKDVETAEVVAAIRAVARGESRIEPVLATRLLQEFQRVWQETGTDPRSRLNEREVAILRLIAGGLSNKAIAADLGFAEKTIKNYITVIFQKLHLSDRTQAAVYAVQHGLVADLPLVGALSAA